jgi:hypothetical protein
VSDELPPRRPPLEPFPLLHVVGGKAVSLADLSGQIGALGAQVTSVQSGQVKLARRFDELDASLGDRLGAFHQELALLRHTTLGEGGIQERVTQVEQRTLGAKAAAMTVTGTKWFTLAVGAVGIALQVATSFYPQAVGPLQHLLDFVKQVAQ